MTDVTPHPKPQKRKGNRPRRIIDPKAIVRAKLMYPWCAACLNGPASNGHHVLPADKFGDDVVENIVGICGTGTSRCHGAHHGNPYEHDTGRELRAHNGTIISRVTERRDAEWVNRRIGVTLLKDRQDVIGYVLEKLGDVPGRDYLSRVYYVSL